MGGLIGLLSLCLAVVTAKPTTEDVFGPDLSTLESDHVPHIPSGWRLIGDAAPKDSMKIVLALKQKDPKKLESTLYKVSDPSSPTYGQHLSLSALRDLVMPTEDTVRTVGLWLRAHGVTDCDEVETRDFWICQTNVKTAEKMLPGARLMR